MPQKRKDYRMAVKMYKEGNSIQYAADFYGISRQAMWKILKRRNVVFRPQKRYGKDNHFYIHGNGHDIRVRNITQIAINNGKLTPESCEVCNKSKVDAHHDDYNKPLEVRWLCGTCHRLWHKKNKPVYRVIELPPMEHKKISSMGGKASWENRKRNLRQLAKARLAMAQKRSPA